MGALLTFEVRRLVRSPRFRAIAPTPGETVKSTKIRHAKSATSRRRVATL